MTIDLDATVAPTPLTMKEILEVTADGFILVGVCHRAITHAGIWSRNDATYRCAESVLEEAFAEAKKDLDEWLADMKADGTPRFFNNDQLMAQLRIIDQHYTKLFNSVSNEEIDGLIEELQGRDFNRLLAVAV